MTERMTTFSNGALRFDVTDSGPLDGPVAILLHGFPSNRSSWGAVASELAAAGIRSLAPDQRGYSPAASPRRRRDYRLADLVGDVIALIDAVAAGPGERVHLVGHDWGGAVAWAVAAAVPDRLSGLTVLSTPHPTALAAAVRSSDQALRSSYMGFFQLPVVPELVLAIGLAPLLRASGLPRAAAEEYARALAAPGRRRTALNWYRGLPLADARRPAGMRIRVPSTLISGRRDAFFSQRAVELTGRQIDAPYRLVELDENHWLPELAAETVSAEIVAQIGHPRA